MSDMMSAGTASIDTVLNKSKLKAPVSSIPVSATEPGKLHVIRRNGKITPFDADKIAIAITKAFLAVEGGNAAASTRVRETVALLTQTMNSTFKRRMPAGGMIHIEDIQDQVELTLMREGLQKVAREYVLYREERKRLRASQEQDTNATKELKVTLANGSQVPLSQLKLDITIADACKGLTQIDAQLIIDETKRNLFDGVALADVHKAAIMSARTLIEKEPNYSFACARLLLIDLYQEALGFLGLETQVHFADMQRIYASSLNDYIERGISLELLDSQLRTFDLYQLRHKP